MPLMSIRGYARERGVNDKTIRKAIQAGKIPLVGGMVDSEIADAAWSRNRDGGQQSKLADAAPPTLTRHTAATETALPSMAFEASVSAGALVEEPKEPQFTLAPLTAARIRNTDESTALRELARRKLEGSLLDAEDVERNWGELLQVIKDRLRLIPDDVAPSLAACTDESECRSILMREILTTLGAISKDVAGMAAA